MNWLRSLRLYKSNVVILFLSMAVVMIVTFICMLVFEFLKMSLYPKIGIWASHILTIIFVTMVATVLSYFITYRFISTKEKVSLEHRARILAEESASKAKVQAEIYLDLMGHDLRNLNQIGMGYLEIALDKLDLNEESRMLISKPYEAMESSTRLIDSIKKLQRAKNGDFQTHKISIAQLIQGLIPKYTNIRGREIKVNVVSESECLVSANDILNDVFSNIIENAIKHSIGSLTINISLMRTTLEGKDYCKVAIGDNGPGIKDDIKNKLFMRFEKDKLGTMNSGGLGLYLVKMILEDFNGKAWVEDTVPGDHTKGAKFVILLPAI